MRPLNFAPAPVVLTGSGETAQVGGQVFEWLSQQGGQHIALLETPSGFELNSYQVVERIARYLQRRLSNYNPIVEIVPARKRGTAFSPDDLEILQPLRRASVIFMGPGSPTYAVRQLRGSLAWDVLRAKHRLGSALVFASAATIAIGQWVLPVYEIYKAGEEVHVRRGLNLLADFGLRCSIIPHWNNTDGGKELDTSHCFVGKERFEAWRMRLPKHHLVIGLDEHTALILDFAAGLAHILGKGNITLLRGQEERRFTASSTFPLTLLGKVHFPYHPEQGIRTEIWEWIQAGQEEETDKILIPPEVQELVNIREKARQERDWAKADVLREEILRLGWQVQDTREGPRLLPR